ncbi:unnamed protein product [Caenorhabditis brenneri]
MKLLNFPWLVIVNVIDVMEPIDLITLSMSSKRMRTYIRCQMRRNGVMMHVEIEGPIKFYFRKNSLKPDDPEYTYHCVVVTSHDAKSRKLYRKGGEVYKYFKLSGKTQKIVYTRAFENRVHTLQTYWSDTQHGLTDIFDYACWLLCPRYIEVRVDLKETCFSRFVLVKWLNQHANKFNMIVFEGVKDYYGDLNYSYILDKMKNHNFVCLKMAPSTSFKMEKFNGTMECLYLDQATWVDLMSVKNIKSNLIRLKHCNFNNEQVNGFLKSLVFGPNPEFICLDIYIPEDINIDEPLILDGLNASPTTEKKSIQIRGHEFTNCDSNQFKILGGHECSVSIKDIVENGVWEISIRIWRI